MVNNDGWSNLLVGLGRSRDKTRSTTYTGENFLTDVMLTDMYVSDGIGSQIVKIVADDMTREWINIKNDSDNSIVNELKKLSAESVFNLALKWMRLYGGSGIVLGFDDGKSLDTPVTNNSKINWLEIIPRSQIYIANSIYNNDILSSNYGKVEIYNMQIGWNLEMTNIHYTRFIEFKGEPVPYLKSMADIERRYWGISVLQEAWNSISMLGSAYQAVGNILLEFIIGKYTLAGLRSMLAQGQEEKILSRMEIINMTKSIYNSVLLDESEEYSRDSASVAGFPELLDRFMMLVSAVCRIPVTKLFGRSPAGMNATGEGDLTNYYDIIQSEQGNRLEKPLQRLVNIIAVYLGKASDIETAEFPIDFNPLFQLTEKEQAEVKK